MADPRLKSAIKTGEFVVAPGIYDLVSALIADSLDFNALYVTGYGVVASHMGLPDAGLATYRDMVERIGQICLRARKPVIADADTGYGGLLNVRYTVEGYEAAGVSAIQLEDQEFPKKCGHTPYRRVISTNEMVRKIEVAASTRRSDDLLIIARTDARSALGLDEAILRGRAYAAAGADIVFIESPESEEEMVRIADSIDAPLLANMVNGGRTPLLPTERLKTLGYSVAIHPVLGVLSAAAALKGAYIDLLGSGTTSVGIALMPFAEFNELLGFGDVWEFEERWAERGNPVRPHEGGKPVRD